MVRKIGILAIQGGFLEHKLILEELGAEAIEIRQKSHLENIKLDGIILPGGESTVMSKLLLELKIFNPLKKLIEDGLPVFGTCAGLILLAKDVENNNDPTLATMDISIRRNAYGRQLGSFQTQAEFKQIGCIPMVFIRAPYITSIDNEVEVLAMVDGNIVAARQNNMLVTSFHPELKGDLGVHKYFLNMI